MTHARTALVPGFRLMALIAALWAPLLALADDYADVNQLMRSGKVAEALAKADHYLAAKPRDPQMRFLRGVLQSEAGRTADAIATFTKLTEEYPELPEPYNNLAVLYAGQSQFDKARAALEAAIRTNPSYATAHENLGDVYAKLASQAYSKALQLDASNAGVQPKLALIRELFSPAGKAAAKPASAPASAAAPPPAASPILPTASAAAARAPASASTVAKAPAAAPVAAAKTPAPAAPPTASTATASAPAAVPSSGPNPNARGEVEFAVLAWAAAWSAKDVNAYLGAYGREFDPPGKLPRKTWEDERRARIAGKSHINVKISDLFVVVDGGKATAKFKQAYSADGLNISSRKTLEMVRSGDRWLIVRESTGA